VRKGCANASEGTPEAVADLECVRGTRGEASDGSRQVQNAGFSSKNPAQSRLFLCVLTPVRDMQRLGTPRGAECRAPPHAALAFGRRRALESVGILTLLTPFADFPTNAT